jgi:hypothetical protein
MHGIGLVIVNDLVKVSRGFLVSELDLHEIPERALLREAGQCLVDMVAIWDTCGWRMEPWEVNATIGKYSRFLALTAEIPGMEIPKKHLGMHLVKEALHLGNPRFYAVWKDESLNKLLRNTCRFVSQSTFDESVLSSMRMCLARGTFDL